MITDRKHLLASRGGHGHSRCGGARAAVRAQVRPHRHRLVVLGRGHLLLSNLSWSCLHLLILGRQITRRGMSSGRTKVIPDDRLHVDDDLLGTWEGHHQVLLVDVPPAGEQAVGGQEEEQVLPLKVQVVTVEHLGKLEEEEGKDEEEKKKPWKQESSSPGSQPMTRQTVAHC